MTNTTYMLLKVSLLLSCVLLILSLLLLLWGGGLSLESYTAYLYAKELSSMPAAILLVAVIASACVEEITMEK